MTSTATKILSKIDDFSVAVSISELSGLAKGLLQLQHARYPHLVPMYRTVHRTKPRELVLRAIRWVNPKRMFPGAGLTKEEMANMSLKDLSDLIVKLNDYRGEAHVIHNRYNQMIDMINMGELPYFIPFAKVKQDKWNMLQEYMDRAVRLKDGTKEWEHVLDRQALEIREILNKKHDTKLDDINGLWVDAKGNAAAPNFMDIKKGKEAKRLLRQNRITPDGKRVRHAPKVYVRRFIAVPKAEQRRGEEIRMPAGGRVRRPGRNDRAGRKVFDEHGGAAGHLVRVPKGPFIGTDADDLRDKGQLLSMPAGRKDPKILAFSEVSDEDVANRRLARWTHTDPLGKRGQAPHIGGHSAAGIGADPEPHGTGAPIRRDPGDLARAEAQVRAQQQAQQAAAAPAGPPAPVGTVDVQSHVSERIQQAARKINGEFAQATSNLLKKFGASADKIANHERLKSLSDADIASIKAMGGNNGINERDGVVLNVTLNDGSHVIYKVVPNEQKSEVVADAIDKLFNLNINSDTVSNDNISAKFLLQKLGLRPDSRRGRILIDGLARGGGHIQEFCQPNCNNMDTTTHSKTALYANEGFRNDIHKMMMNDWLTGNWDRHYNNFMVDGNGRAVQIDTGFGGGFAWDYRNNPGAGVDFRGELMATEGGGAAARHQHRGKKPGNMSQDELKAEIEAVFEDHFSLEKFQALKQEFNMGQANNFSTIEEFKQNFLDIAGKTWLPINESFGQANPPEGSV